MLRHALVCGLGSMGRRHLRHLRQLGVPRVDAWRSGLATLSDVNQPAPDSTFSDLAAALACRPQLVIVATPTALHMPAALAAVEAGCHVLVEKPLSHSLAGVAALQDAAQRQGVMVAVGCNLRFHPLLRRLAAMVHEPGPLGAALAARLHFDACLPRWHPWEDYRASYAARGALGGGAALTHIHEIDYALWLFGAASQACGLSALAQPLGTDVDETSSLVIQHSTGVLSTLQLSLCAPLPSRGVTVNFAQGVWSADLIAGTWHSRDAAGATEQGRVDAAFDFDTTYALQLRNVVDAMAGRAPLEVGLAAGIEALEVALSVRQSLRSPNLQRSEVA